MSYGALLKTASMSLKKSADSIIFIEVVIVLYWFTKVQHQYEMINRNPRILQSV